LIIRFNGSFPPIINQVTVTRHLIRGQDSYIIISGGEIVARRDLVALSSVYCQPIGTTSGHSSYRNINAINILFIVFVGKSELRRNVSKARNDAKCYK